MSFLPPNHHSVKALMEHKASYLLWPNYIHLTPEPITITFVNFAVSDITSVHQLSVPVLPLSFTPNLITAILSTINSLSLHYPVSSRSRTFLLVLSLKLLSSAVSLPSDALSTGSKSLNASNKSSSHLPTKFSQLPNLLTFITSSLFNVLAVLALHRPPTISSLKVTDRCFRYASPFLWNRLPLSLRQPHSGTSSFFATYPFLHLSPIPLLIQHSAHP